MPKISLDVILQRVKKKREDYLQYNFERLQEEAFASFFDLAQEYTSLEALYLISVAVPKVFFQLESRLYLINLKQGQLRLVCTSREGIVPDARPKPHYIKLSKSSYREKSSFVFPIKGNMALSERVPFHIPGQVLGMFEILSQKEIDENTVFFFEKFTNRIGYNLHQKMLIQQNIEHIKFINRLVADIEHNVISPNLYYKLFFRKLERRIENFKELKKTLDALKEHISGIDQETQSLLNRCRSEYELNVNALEQEKKEAKEHYEHTSLFLETLFRRDHFVKGTYVLREQRCNFKKEIIEPLLHRYLPRFKEKGIVIENRLEDVPDDEIELVVDKGLISQVFDNYFSNALKYTREIVDHFGNRVKFISCGRHILKDYFDKGIDGIEFTVFTTGSPLSPEEAEKVYEEGYRGLEMGLELGTGHGLSFVYHVIQIHGGQVGCKPQKNGNLFYFILPKKRNARSV